MFEYNRKRRKMKSGILKKVCPYCFKQKLLVGPFYDRLRITCLECGARFRLKLKAKES
jgi:hypothetical protein